MKQVLILLLSALVHTAGAQDMGGINPEDLPVQRVSVSDGPLSITLKKISLATGVTLEYAEQGEATGMPVIFLHGITDSWHSFERTFSFLPKQLHAFALTQRGHGGSGKPATGYAPTDFARDVASFIKAKRLAPAVIVGHSMGGVNALQLAIDYPELVKALVIVNSDPAFGNNPSMTAFLNDVLAMKGQQIDKAFMTEFQRSTLVRPIDSTTFNLYVREGLKCPLPVFQEALKGLLTTNLLSRVDRIQVPVAVFWGDQDGICLKAGQDNLLKKLPQARRFLWEGQGHALHWEKPETFARELTQFLNATVLKTEKGE